MAQGNTQTLRTTNTYAMAVTALMTAVTCILAPLSIPIGPVPISPEESESLPDQLADISLVSSQWQSLPVL